MSLKSKLLMPCLFLVATLVFSGCGQKSPEPITTGSDSNLKFSEEASEALPAPTGKADDVVDSAEDEMTKEDSELKGEDGEAESLLDDSQETNDFGQSYDENEF